MKGRDNGGEILEEGAMLDVKVGIRTHLLRPNTQSNLLVVMIEYKDSILYFVTPEQLISFEILHSVVCRYELADTSISNVSQILLRFIPGLGYSDCK